MKSEDPKKTSSPAGTPPRPVASDSAKIDRNAPPGSKNSLGAESVRDSRPSTDDSVVEAIDEADPDVTAP